MNEAMIRECKLHGYTGFQIDFENIDWTDRDLLTALVKNCPRRPCTRPASS